MGAAPGSLPLVYAPNTINSGGAFLQGPGDIPAGHATRTVPVVALDGLALPRPISFIKADIEGAEPLAFRGADALLRADRPVILSELHPLQLERVSGVTPAQFIAEMRARGYRCHLLGAGVPGEEIDDAPATASPPSCSCLRDRPSITETQRHGDAQSIFWTEPLT